MNKQIIVFIILLILQVSAKAESYINASGFFSKNKTLENLSGLSNDFYCNSNFEEINSLQIGSSLAFSHRLNNWFLVGGSVSFSAISLDFYGYEKTLIGIDDKIFNGLIQTGFETKLPIYFIEINPAIFQFTKNLLLETKFGYGFSGKNDYYKYEKLIEPLNQGVFKETQTRIRNEAQGVQSSAYKFFKIGVAVKYIMPMLYNKNNDELLYLAPQIEYDWTFNKYFNSSFWISKNFTYKLGLQFKLN